MIHGIKNIKTRLLNAIAIARTNKHGAKHGHNSTACDGYNTGLRATYGAKTDNASVSRRASKIVIAGIASAALLGQTASDYTSIAQTILQLMTIAIPIFVVIAVVRMIFRHLRD
jgi:hypothetical protein